MAHRIAHWIFLVATVLFATAALAQSDSQPPPVEGPPPGQEMQGPGRRCRDSRRSRDRGRRCRDKRCSRLWSPADLREVEADFAPPAVPKLLAFALGYRVAEAGSFNV